MFIPSQTNLIASPKAYKQMLRNHNAFINSITGIPIEGIPKEAMNHTYIPGEKNLRTKIMEYEGVKQIKRTKYTEVKGRWLVIVILFLCRNLYV